MGANERGQEGGGSSSSSKVAAGGRQQRKGGSPIPEGVLNLLEDGGTHGKDVEGIASDVDEEEYPMPHTVKRQCTDTLCLLPFVLFVAPMGYLYFNGVPNADVSRCRHLLDYHGRLCGGGELRDRPYLYLCQDARGRLDVHHPACRAKCPSGSDTEFACVDGGENSTDYKTRLVNEVFCVPTNGELFHQTVFGRSDVQGSDFLLYINMGISAWEPLALAAVWGLVASFGYLYLLKVCAGTIVWMGITLMSVIPLGYGGLVLYCWYQQRFCWLTGAEDLEDARKVVLGSICVIFGSLFACLLLRQNDDIELAISCIEWSVRCIFESPTLLLNPLLVLASRVVVMALSWHTLEEVLSLFLIDMATYLPIVDSRSVLIAAYCVVAWFWIMHFITANSQFAIMYATELWYFHGGLQGNSRARCLTVRGYLTALRYHQGTMALGSLASGFAQPFRIVLGALTGLARIDENPIGACVGAACCCFVNLYEAVLQPISRNAYQEVALRSLRFFPAAYLCQEVMSVDDTVHLLNGATWLFQLAGVGSISFVGFCLTQLLVCRGVGADVYLNPGEDDYVYNVGVFSLFGLVISGVVAFPFMMLFDVVSDTILYCYTTEQLRKLDDEQEDETWFDSVRRQLGELAGCACSLRAKPLPTQPQVEYYAASPPEGYASPGGAAPGRPAAAAAPAPSRGAALGIAPAGGTTPPAPAPTYVPMQGGYGQLYTNEALSGA